MAALCKPETQVIDRSGPLPGRLVLERDEEVVGRSSDCSICVRSVMVSRRHAVFRRDASGQWRVADDSSMNGVYVNGQRVEAERPRLLRQDDVVSLGPPQRTNVVFRFATDDPRHRGGDAGQRPKDATTSRPRAFLIMIGGANLLPKELDSGNKVSHRAAVSASDESESDSSPVLPSDRDNNNVFVQPGASPSGFAVAGRSDAFPKHSKKIRLSASDCVVRRLESIMENELTCAICSELFVDAAMLQCGHTFCSYCIHNWRQQKNVCPFCLAAIGSVTRSFVVDNIIDELVCFNPELKRFREALAHSRSAASYGDSSKN
ncbi:E3 ubiquitin-protein ligase CHFR-like [Rhipicephalus microplus]|uniref:E3 ubiquitin-protein ligase CHFR-like n=1 Tax=Rhipicephalus microplus TaxID=6941 RepID=UPI003F6B58D0